jgi:hypothetical protein
MSCNFPWTETEVQELRAMRANGLSFSEIGRRLGRTRNEIAGKVARLNLPLPKNCHAKTPHVYREAAR